jgi:LEA14-like dessication related protein
MDSKKFITRFSLIAGAFAFIYGIYKFYEYQIGMALQYCYKIAGIQLNKISTSIISLTILLKIQNKSSFSLLIAGYDLHIYINNLHVANIRSVKEELIANNAISDLSLQINFNPTDVFQIKDIALIATQFMTDKSKILIKISGTFTAKMNFIKIKRPIEFNMSLAEMMSTDSTSEKKKTKCDI